MVSVQAEVPDEQSVAPTWQVFDGVQGVLETHAEQTPEAQTLPVPQAVPLALLPADGQLWTSLVQTTTPVLQTSVGLQTPPATQVPPSDTGGVPLQLQPAAMTVIPMKLSRRDMNVPLDRSPAAPVGDPYRESVLG